MGLGPFQFGDNMIDLRERGLPRTIESGGDVYDLNTDFRVWIEFERSLEEEGVAIFDVFEDERPPDWDTEWVDAAIEFLRSPNATPRAIGSGSSERAVDCILDGEYIVASFQAAYGIDLTDPELEMHWHRFKALLGGLPDGCKLSEIAGYRTWRRDTRKRETVMAELKRAWELPDRGEEAAMEEARKIAAELYEMQMGGAE